MSANQTRVRSGSSGSMSRRTFLGAVGLGGVALLGGSAAGRAVSSNSKPARYALIDYPRGQTYPLHAGINRIGRDATSDIVFPENWISRRHCTLCVFDGGTFELRDTNSRNGTNVNGKRVTEAVRLAVGDFIRICDRGLVLVDLTAPPPLLEPGRPVPGSLEWAEAVRGSLAWAEANGYLDSAYEPGWL